MQRRTLTDSKTTSGTTNGHALRRSQSWIESFIASTDNLESPPIFRRWAAISTIAAALEQRVYLQAKSILFPNIYCFLVGHPGVGKTMTIRAAKRYYAETPEPHIAPTSMTAASMIDALLRSKRSYVLHTDAGLQPLEYNSMYIGADELGTFMHKHENEVIAILSAFYDPDAYGHERRGGEIKIKIKSPQLNIICGSTPANLMNFLPESAWEQGFTSRVVMVFSDERTIGDDFSVKDSNLNPDLIHDLKSISGLMGKFEVTAEYRNAVANWRTLGEPPVPDHPKLLHYATRRRVHLYKLSMVSAVDRSDTLLLTRDDFNRAMGWLREAEMTMPDIFKAGAGNADARAMDEAYHFVLTSCVGKDGMCPERKLTAFLKERIPIHSVVRALELMERSGQIKAVAIDKRTGQRMFKVGVPDIDMDGDLA